MAAVQQKDWPVKQYTPRHTSWPYSEADFSRSDETSDSSFYGPPRFVNHIDDAAIADLRIYYDSVLPTKGKILDFCSSWVSHYPPSIEQAAEKGELQIVGLGMNKAELDRNPVLNAGRLVVDLNENPDIAKALTDYKIIKQGSDGSDYLDAATNVVSTDYLTQPVAVLRSLREVTKKGGAVHLIISNRCFPTKAINRWLKISEEERLLMVGDFLHFAGWSKIEIVELSNGKVNDDEQAEQPQGLQGLMAWLGGGRRDPLWAVRAIND